MSEGTEGTTDEIDFAIQPSPGVAVVEEIIESLPSSSGNLDKANRLLRLSKELISKLKFQLQEEKNTNNQTQQDFSRYRMRMELSKTQRDMEIEKLSVVNLKYKQYNVVSHDVLGELESLRRRYELLEKEKTNALRESLRLTVELEKEKKEKKVWVGEFKECKARMEEIGPDTFARVTGQMNEQLVEVRREFKQFREMTAVVLEEKERELAKARNSSETATELAYIRDVVLKYFANANDAQSKTSMEAAIATVLRFTKAEVEYVRDKRKDDLGFLKRFYA